MSDSFTEIRRILKSELITATGCTEPIALAYGAACCRKLLGTMPDRIDVECSGNIIKNAKSVTVPNCNGLKGIDTAVAIGTVSGDADAALEVLKNITSNDIASAIEYLQSHSIVISLLESDSKLHFVIRMRAGIHHSLIEIKDVHTRIVRVERDGKSIVSETDFSSHDDSISDFMKTISVASIIEYAEQEDAEFLSSAFSTQIKDNWDIATEGLRNNWGTGIGGLIEQYHLGGAFSDIEALAAAASDARMSGCPMPVVINCGSGNQGLTVSVPVVAYARKNSIPEDKLLRALAISNLLALYQKASIGRLSAFCGAVTAATGAGAAITWIADGSLRQIEDTVVNTLAIVSGIICDGAKPSCAGKIAICVNAALIAHSMAMCNSSFSSGDGIVKKNADETISGVGMIASQGMKATDDVILSVMLA